MVSVSARSYLAAGLVTAMAGVAVIGPLAAQRQVHLPNVLSANVKLSSAETALSKTEMAVADLAINAVTDVEKAGRQKAQGGSASPAAVPAATAAVSAPDAKTATVHALANVALAVDARPSSQHVAGAAAVQPNPAASAAATAGPSPSAIIAVPLLVADIGLDITFALFAIPNNLLSNTGALVFHLVTHQGDFQDDLRAIANVIPHDLGLLASDVSADIRSIGDALGLDANGFGGNAVATLAAGASTSSRVVGAASLVNVAPKSVEKPGAVHAKPDVKGDTTDVEAPQRHTNEPDTTKGDTKTADAAKANAAKGDTTKDETTKAAAGKGDTAKPGAHSASTGSSASTASSAEHSTVSSAAKGSSTRSGTSARTHRTPGASSHAGGSGAKNGSGAHGGGKHGK